MNNLMLSFVKRRNHFVNPYKIGQVLVMFNVCNPFFFSFSLLNLLPAANTLVLQENLDIEWSTVSQALCTFCDFLQQQSSFIQTYVSNSTIDWPIEYNIKEIAAKLLSKDEL